MTYIIAYIATAVVFFGLDFIWLSRVAIGFYKSKIGPLMLEKPNFAAAGIFYLFYIAGIVYFAVAPALNGGEWSTAMISGAILGFIAYGTYDMTNLSTLKNWSLSMSIVDIIWGTVLTSIAATAGFAITRLFV